MELEKLSMTPQMANAPEGPFGGAFSQPGAEALDCAWISFLGRDAADPLTSRSLQWIDWKMQGLISRYVIDEGFKMPATTFIPTMKKLPVPYLAIDPGASPNWETFLKNCEGLRLKNILLFCETESVAERLEKELSRHKKADYPERVTLVYDSTE